MFQDMQTEAIREALNQIAENNNGVLNPEQVVDEARDHKSVLHDYFEWDDTEAAKRYRIVQAQGLIRRIKITVIKIETKSKEVKMKPVRAFQSRPSNRGSNGGYESIQDIASDRDKHQEMVEQALRELQAIRRRFAEIESLSEVWEAIDEAVETTSKAHRKTTRSKVSAHDNRQQATA